MKSRFVAMMSTSSLVLVYVATFMLQFSKETGNVFSMQLSGHFVKMAQRRLGEHSFSHRSFAHQSSVRSRYFCSSGGHLCHDAMDRGT